MISNPFVDYLNRYSTASPDHEAAFDEFIAQVPEPPGGKLRLETPVEDFLRTRFSQANPPSVILTGDAGDGKTYLCRQIISAFTGQPFISWEQIAEQPIERDGRSLRVIKDLSELGDSRGIAILQALAKSIEDQTSERYLIAANEGRLRALLNNQSELYKLNQKVNHQLQSQPNLDSADLVVINLTDIRTSSFVPEVLDWMTQDSQWQACQSCPIQTRCPIRLNALRLQDTHIRKRVQLLYQILEYLDIHVTMRDMLIHLAYTLTGDQRCAKLQEPNAPNHNFAYYVNIWGGRQSDTFQRRSSVIKQLARLHIGERSNFVLDDLIITGGETAEEQTFYQRIFAPAVDLNHRQFEQDRTAYVVGTAESTTKREPSALMSWLPQCRQKLFFEWPDEKLINQLIPFRYLQTYLQLTDATQNLSDQLLRELVLGLNRAFSRLYLTDTEYLYVTTHYHSAIQSRPLVRLRIPASAITISTERYSSHKLHQDAPALSLHIVAPSALLHKDPSAANRPVRWPLNLLLFEYILRLAHGGTYNILAEECELSVRSLKDQLLFAFAQSIESSDSIEFFVAEKRNYTLKKLRIDGQNHTIRQG